MPGYSDAIDAGVRTVNQGEANAGNLYSGSRGLALRDAGQNVQQSYYTNYMNLLQNMANPKSTTNMASVGVGQAGTIGAQNISATNQANAYRMAGTEAQNAAIADITGALGSGISAYMNRPPSGGGRGGVTMAGMNDYSGFV